MSLNQSENSISYQLPYQLPGKHTQNVDDVYDHSKDIGWYEDEEGEEEEGTMLFQYMLLNRVTTYSKTIGVLVLVCTSTLSMSMRTTK